jgi:ribosome recycling factor
MCEEGKVSLRNSRRTFVEKVKVAEKNKLLDKDTSKHYQVSIFNLFLSSANIQEKYCFGCNFITIL